VRLAHWALAVLVVVELFNEASANPWHRYLGYAAAGIVLARLAWSLVVPGEARLERMLAVARQARAYAQALRAGKRPRYVGHNPLGALMTLALWTLVLAIGVTGWMTQLDAFWGEEWLHDAHAALAYALGAAALAHVAGVLITSRLYRINLPASMVTGRKKEPPSPRQL
jgi:cytochrome b